MTPRALLLLALAFAVDANAQGSLASENPFRPAAGAAAPQNAPAETIEFAGVSKVGDKIDLIFYDKAAKKSRWVPLKSTVEGIEALNYDAKTEQAVVKINGTEKRLPLRKGTGPLNAPGAVAPMHTGFSTPSPLPPAPVMTAPPVAQPAVVMTAPAPATPAQSPAAAPAVPATPEGQAKQEQEARMLVSDLLDIGMAQRKAYEEAQKKAQGGEAQTTPASGQPAATPPQPAPTNSR